MTLDHTHAPLPEPDEAYVREALGLPPAAPQQQHVAILGCGQLRRERPDRDLDATGRRLDRRSDRAGGRVHLEHVPRGIRPRDFPLAFVIQVRPAFRQFLRLRIDEPGPGYCHFPMERDPEYFKQLTAERQIIKYNKGFAHRVWVKSRTRNEALDVRVYGIAALAILNVNLDSVYNKFYANVSAKERPVVKAEKPHPLADPRKLAKRPGAGGFVNSWR